VVVWVAWRLDRVLDELLECRALADELDEFRNAASPAEHYKLFLLLQELFNCAAIFLVQKLVDLHVSSETT
jgi:hypothetical protein